MVGAVFSMVGAVFLMVGAVFLMVGIVEELIEKKETDVFIVDVNGILC